MSGKLNIRPIFEESEYRRPSDMVGTGSHPSAPYLQKLNLEQRRAVEHGRSALAEAGPLLIIAGAGTGKTNTLANRVAHLIVNGAELI
jgi:hypothetical protein